MFVAEFDCPKELLHQLSRLALCEPCALCDLVKELSAFAKLRNDVQLFFILIIFVKLDDIRVVDLAHDLDLVFDPLDLLGVGAVLLDDFYCPLYSGVVLEASSPDLPETSLSQNLVKDVLLGHWSLVGYDMASF